MSVSAERRRSMKRLCAVALAYFGLVVFVYGTYVWYSYDFSRPHHAVPGEGRVYSSRTHGSVVYLTAKEAIWLRAVGLRILLRNGWCVDRLQTREGDC